MSRFSSITPLRFATRILGYVGTLVAILFYIVWITIIYATLQLAVWFPQPANRIRALLDRLSVHTVAITTRPLHNLEKTDN